MQDFLRVAQAFCLNGRRMRATGILPADGRLPSMARHYGLLRALGMARCRAWLGTTVCCGRGVGRRQEKSRLANQAASVLVGCQGFEPWTY